MRANAAPTAQVGCGARLRLAAARLALMLGGLVAVLLVMELVVFRFVLRASDVPRLEFVDGIIKYRPNQTGIYREGNEIASRYRINQQGWNSGHERYDLARTTARRRIAVVGDSFVEAFAVDYRRSLAEQLEQRLGPDRVEVYRFGVSGAPLSQYVHLLRHEVAAYRPDVVVVVIVHNDFLQSFLHTPGVYTSSFLKVRLDGAKVTGEIEPTRFVQPWYGFLRDSATWRYLSVRRHVRFAALRGLLFGRSALATGHYQADVDIDVLNRELPSPLREVTAYLLDQLAATCHAMGAQPLLLMDGDLGNLYDGAPAEELYAHGVLQLNRLTAALAAERGLPFIDLHPRFAASYGATHRRANSVIDYHWNEAGHQLACEAVERWLREQAWMDGGGAPGEAEPSR